MICKCKISLKYNVAIFYTLHIFFLLLFSSKTFENKVEWIILSEYLYTFLWSTFPVTQTHLFHCESIASLKSSHPYCESQSQLLQTASQSSCVGLRLSVGYEALSEIDWFHGLCNWLVKIWIWGYLDVQSILVSQSAFLDHVGCWNSHHFPETTDSPFAHYKSRSCRFLHTLLAQPCRKGCARRVWRSLQLIGLQYYLPNMKWHVFKLLYHLFNILDPVVCILTYV